MLYQRPARQPQPRESRSYLLADESQSGFRMFNTLDDDTVDTSVNWAMLSNTGGRPTQFKFGVSYVERNRDFQSRRFRFIPVILTKDGPALTNLSAPPETLYASNNIGTAFRFNEETRPTDAYDGNQTTASGYGMVDIAFSGRTRMIAGARVERFDQEVNTFDPFGLFVRTITSSNKNTDFFPAINFVQAMAGQLEPAAELRRHGQSSGVPRAGRVRVHRCRRQPRDQRQSRLAAGAHPQRRRALGDVHRHARRHREQRVLQVLRQAD